jgi:hypothetical protein
MNADSNSGIDIRVDYEQTLTAYASQFVLRASDEEIVIDCSPGILMNPDGSGRLPISTRLVLSYAAAHTLSEMLSEATARHSTQAAILARESTLQARFPQPHFNSPPSRVLEQR